MKKILLLLVAHCFLVIGYAQSTFNQHEAFDPNFYPQSGNEFRSAGGEPGPRYWQNRADYKINATLDTALHKITGDVEITYTNNSPDNLKFLWLQLDQNIYRKESRASATTTQSGGRWANARFTEGEVIKTLSIDVEGKKVTPEYTVSDTRMQVWLK
ncbi:MAG: M1 family peptidase, partial [Flavisolibacter sp.]|nr:M1 family peptidase [Flavisolibacter sp.]